MKHILPFFTCTSATAIRIKTQPINCTGIRISCKNNQPNKAAKTTTRLRSREGVVGQGVLQDNHLESDTQGN